MYKRVKSAAAAEREAAILRGLRERGTAVPEVLGCRDALLILEYLPGEPLPDIIERGGYDCGDLAGALCDWFAAFYAAAGPGEARGDVNGRNFLYDGTRIYGVDFEERQCSPPAQDAGRLAAFIATYNTHDPRLRDALARTFALEFAVRFDCEPGDIERYRDEEYAAMGQRRR